MKNKFFFNESGGGSRLLKWGRGGGGGKRGGNGQSKGRPIYSKMQYKNAALGGQRGGQVMGIEWPSPSGDLLPGRFARATNI